MKLVFIISSALVRHLFTDSFEWLRADIEVLKVQIDA